MAPAHALKQKRLEARIAPGQKRLIERAAELRGTSVTDFIVSAAHEAAMATIRSFETLRLQDDDRSVFISALLHPPKPNAAAKKAVTRYRRRVGS